MKKKLVILAIIILIAFTFSACREQADTVSKNLSKEADNFNVTRRIVVMNARTDTILFEMIGTFSINTNSAHSELEIVCELEDGSYQKHFIYLNENTLYVVEDISHTNVSKYHYELNVLPEQIVPFTLTFND